MGPIAEAVHKPVADMSERDFWADIYHGSRAYGIERYLLMRRFDANLSRPIYKQTVRKMHLELKRKATMP